MPKAVCFLFVRLCVCGNPGWSHGLPAKTWRISLGKPQLLPPHGPCSAPALCSGQDGRAGKELARPARRPGLTHVGTAGGSAGEGEKLWDSGRSGSGSGLCAPGLAASQSPRHLGSTAILADPRPLAPGLPTPPDSVSGPALACPGACFPAASAPCAGSFLLGMAADPTRALGLVFTASFCLWFCFNPPVFPR